MSTHTPGLWKLDRQQHAEVVHADGIVIADVFTPQETMFGTMRTASPEEYAECEANARLIAAAPQLLEALKALLCEPMAERTVDAAKRAIRAAEGTSNRPA